MDSKELHESFQCEEALYLHDSHPAFSSYVGVDAFFWDLSLKICSYFPTSWHKKAGIIIPAQNIHRLHLHSKNSSISLKNVFNQILVVRTDW